MDNETLSTSSEGRRALDREGKANLMNGLIDGYRDGGRDWFAVEGGGDTCGHQKNPEHIEQSSRFIGGDVFNEKKVGLLAVAVQDWQKNIWEERLSTITPADQGN